MEDQKKNVEEELRQLIAEILERKPGEIKPETRFVEDLGMDSMMALEILVAIEKKYKIKISEENLRKIATLDEIISLLKEYLN